MKVVQNPRARNNGVSTLPRAEGEKGKEQLPEPKMRSRDEKHNEREEVTFGREKQPG